MSAKQKLELIPKLGWRLTITRIREAYGLWIYCISRSLRKWTQNTPALGHIRSVYTGTLTRHVGCGGARGVSVGSMSTFTVGGGMSQGTDDRWNVTPMAILVADHGTVRSARQKCWREARNDGSKTKTVMIQISVLCSLKRYLQPSAGRESLPSAQKTPSLLQKPLGEFCLQRPFTLYGFCSQAAGS